jgi:hypothetical protein
LGGRSASAGLWQRRRPQAVAAGGSGVAAGRAGGGAGAGVWGGASAERATNLQKQKQKLGVPVVPRTPKRKQTHSTGGAGL